MTSSRQEKRSYGHEVATESPKLRYRKHWFEQWLYHALSDQYGGNDTMPLGGHEVLYYKDDGVDYVASFQEDAHELGFGYPDEWKLFITRKNFHKVMRWYLWRWALRDWFGLKRYIWYKLLHRMVNRQITKATEVRKQTKLTSERITPKEGS